MNELDIFEKEMQRTPEKQAELNAIIQQQAKAEAEYLDMVEWYRTKEQCTPNALSYIITIIITIIIVKFIDYISKPKQRTSDK